jgi:hypothetical protein
LELKENPVPFGVYRISGSRVTFPISITLFGFAIVRVLSVLGLWINPKVDPNK